MTSQSNKRPFTLVVAVDFSEQAERALIAAAEMAHRTALSAVHVVYAIPAVPASQAVPLGYEEMCRSGRAQLEALLGRMKLGLPATLHAIIGEPVEVIVDVATNLGADLIVTGTHGRRGVARLAFGSVAEALVRRAPCSVLVARDRSPAPDEKIEPPCLDCVARAQATKGAEIWCDRHSTHHVRAHTYHESPTGADFGMGSLSFRQPTD